MPRRVRITFGDAGLAGTLTLRTTGSVGRLLARAAAMDAATEPAVSKLGCAMGAASGSCSDQGPDDCWETHTEETPSSAASNPALTVPE
jgi:hypothetical protein